MDHYIFLKENEMRTLVALMAAAGIGVGASAFTPDHQQIQASLSPDMIQVPQYATGPADAPPVLIEADPSKVGLTRTPDGITKAVIMNGNRSVSSAQEGEKWLPKDRSTTYIALRDGTFAEAGTPAANQAVESSHHEEQPACPNCGSIQCADGSCVVLGPVKVAMAAKRHFVMSGHGSQGGMHSSSHGMSGHHMKSNGSVGYSMGHYEHMPRWGSRRPLLFPGIRSNMAHRRSGRRMARACSH